MTNVSVAICVWLYNYHSVIWEFLHYLKDMMTRGCETPTSWLILMCERACMHDCMRAFSSCLIPTSQLILMACVHACMRAFSSCLMRHG